MMETRHYTGTSIAISYEHEQTDRQSVCKLKANSVYAIRMSKASSYDVYVSLKYDDTHGRDSVRI